VRAEAKKEADEAAGKALLREQFRGALYGEKFARWCACRKPEPASVSVPLVGIPNPGTTCYVNVLLQAFASCPLLVAYMEAAEHRCDAEECALLDLCAHFSDRRKCSSCAQVPRIVRRILSSWHGDQDAGEALLLVLQQLEEACLDHEEVFGKLQLERGRTSLLRLLFGLDFSQEVTCTKCTYTEWSSTQDYRLNIQVGMKEDATSLDDLFEEWGSWEDMDENARCDECKAVGCKRKRVRIERGPNCLLLMLDRAMRCSAFGKNNRHVDFQEYFVIPGSADKATYRLWCVVVHLDLKRCVVFGHYICFVRQDDRWYKCDDETVSPAREEEVFSQRACMLCYEREEPFTTPPEYPLSLPEAGHAEQPPPSPAERDVRDAPPKGARKKKKKK
jgi:ubiquitin carboxyl-terminal hydrolase 36/42